MQIVINRFPLAPETVSFTRILFSAKFLYLMDFLCLFDKGYEVMSSLIFTSLEMLVYCFVNQSA
jgi:hypothetical protein